MKLRHSAVVAIALSMSGIAYANTSASSSVTMDQSTIRQVQQALKDAGYDPGTIDGQMGPKTKGALNNFQQSKGITKTASLDGATLSALGVQGQGSASSSTQGSTSGGVTNDTSASTSASPSTNPSSSTSPDTSSSTPSSSSTSSSSSTK